VQNLHAAIACIQVLDREQRLAAGQLAQALARRPRGGELCRRARHLVDREHRLDRTEAMVRDTSARRLDRLAGRHQCAPR
jgi:hypothetical protein